jgi:hypothetical protein
MKKNDRLEAWLAAWDDAPRSRWPREYRAFFVRFNQGDYYEAHDVLEHLWLRCTDSNRSFFQALIQFAGAFVHFKKHALHPHHPTHSRRIPPGCRLLDLAAKRLQSFPGPHLGIIPSEIIAACELWRTRAQSGLNPLNAFPPPQLSGPQDN